MRKTNEKLPFFLSCVKPVLGLNRIKISSFRHPCPEEGEYDRVRKNVRDYLRAEKFSLIAND